MIDMNIRIEEIINQAPNLYEVKNFGVLICKSRPFETAKYDIEEYEYKGEKYVIIYHGEEPIRFCNAKSIKGD